MARPNFYLLLDLDPLVTDWPTVEKAITAKRRQWSTEVTMGNPTERRKKEGYLKLIPEIEAFLQQAENRRSEGQKAQRELKTQHNARLKALDELIEVLGSDNPDKTFSAKDVRLLVQKSGKTLTEEQVRERLARAGFQPQAETPKPQASRSRLEPTVAKSIRANLEILELEDLYRFLDLPSRSSPKSLFDKADEVYKELNRKGKIDPESSARQELAGLCKAVFRDADAKMRYDNTLAVEAMETLRPAVEIAGRDRLLTRAKVVQIVNKARQRGVSESDAMAWLEEVAAKRKWVLQKGTDRPGSKLKLCGACESLARSPDDTHCPKCGEALVQPCPQCGHPTPTEDVACSRCGCHTGDGPLVKSLLSEGQRKAREGEIAAAIALFDRALHYWPAWQPVVEARRQAQERQQTRERALDRIEEAVRERRLEDARVLLERLRRRFGAGKTAAIGQRIDAGLSLARKSFETAQAHRRAGRSDAAFDGFEAALRHCADFEPAQKALARLPPPAPARLRVKQVGPHSLRLSWPAVESRGELSYRLVRKIDGRPAGPDDGTVIAEVRMTAYDETSVRPGIVWVYAVFTSRSGIFSTAGAFSRPQLLPERVTGFRAETADGEVQLLWTAPRGAMRVEVHRVSPGGRRELPVNGHRAHDCGLENRRRYRYEAVAVYRHPEGRGEKRGQPARVEATPASPPPRVRNLAARRNRDTVVLTWSSKEPIEIQVRMSRQPPVHKPGHILPRTEAQHYGQPVTVSAAGQGRAELSGRGVFHFVPLAIEGELAAIGDPVVVVYFEEIGNLRARTSGGDVFLSWTWPVDASAAVVSYSYNRFPRRPEDGVRETVVRASGDRTGAFTLRGVERRRHYFSVFVHDPASGRSSEGANVLESMGQTTTVFYRVARSGGGLFSRPRRAVIELRSSEACGLEDLQVVYGKRFPPTAPDAGEVLWSVPRVELADGVGTIDVPEVHLTKKGYLKLFQADPADVKNVRLQPEEKELLRLG